MMIPKNTTHTIPPLFDCIPKNSPCICRRNWWDDGEEVRLGLVPGLAGDPAEGGHCDPQHTLVLLLDPLPASRPLGWARDSSEARGDPAAKASLLPQWAEPRSLNPPSYTFLGGNRDLTRSKKRKDDKNMLSFKVLEVCTCPMTQTHTWAASRRGKASSNGKDRCVLHTKREVTTLATLQLFTFSRQCFNDSSNFHVLKHSQY